MDTLKHLFLESPFYLYLGLAVAELALAAIWYERRSRRVAAALIVPPVLACVIFAVSAFVVTDREQLAGAASEIARAIETGQLHVAADRLHDNFAGRYEGARLNKKDALAKCASEKQRYAIRRIRPGDVTVEITGRTARMVAPTRMEIESGLAGYSAKVTFVLQWVKTADGWKIIEAEEPQVSRF